MIPLESITQFEEYPKIIENTEKIIRECNFEFEFKPLNKKYYWELERICSFDKSGLRRIVKSKEMIIQAKAKSRKGIEGD
jgi:DNA polymerase III alpha subunit